MKNFRLLHAGLDVAPILAELNALPEWGQYAERKTRDGTPHGDMTDLWIRYFPRETLKEPADFNRPGQCVFYPVWDRLPSLHPLVWGLMGSQQSVELGGIMCVRLPPGGRIERHTDIGGWHASHYNFKCYVVLEANARCVVECDGDEQVFRPGEIFEFSNQLPHSMCNDGDTMRTTLIICMRKEPAPQPQLPIETNIHMCDGLFVKHAVFAAGTHIPQHSHGFDHLSVIATGAVRVWQDGEVLGEYRAPAGIVIKAHRKHRFLALEPMTTVLCVHRLDENGDVPIDELHELELED